MTSALLEYPAGAALPNGVQMQGAALGTGTRYSETVIVSRLSHKTMQPERQFFLFELAERYRRLFLLSPVWVAAAFILLAYLGNPEVKKVLEFMAPWSSGPFER